MYPASFKQLQALVQVARHQSVSRAAEAMHVTQPAVSLHLKLLEEAAGIPLTRKQGRNIQMTSAGELLVGYAERILKLWEEAGDEVAAVLRDRPERVNVIATGRDAPPSLIAVADTVTEMRKVKHAYDEGIKALKGIEY